MPATGAGVEKAFLARGGLGARKGNMRTISRDPFARENLVRRTIHKACECLWCGVRSNRMFNYGIERDDKNGRVEWHGRVFCSIGCFRDYTGAFPSW